MFSAISLPILLSHLNAVHSDGDFKVICGLGDAPDCKKLYTKYNSFYKHIRRKQDDIYKGRTKPPDGATLLCQTMKPKMNIIAQVYYVQKKKVAYQIQQI